MTVWPTPVTVVGVTDFTSEIAAEQLVHEDVLLARLGSASLPRTFAVFVMQLDCDDVLTPVMVVASEALTASAPTVQVTVVPAVEE